MKILKQDKHDLYGYKFAENLHELEHQYGRDVKSFGTIDITNMTILCTDMEFEDYTVLQIEKNESAKLYSIGINPKDTSFTTDQTLFLVTDNGEVYIVGHEPIDCKDVTTLQEEFEYDNIHDNIKDAIKKYKPNHILVSM